VPILAVLVVIGGGAGAWFSGALDMVMAARLPVADPYTLIVEKTAEGTGRIAGHIPSEEAQASLTSQLAPLNPDVNLLVARGTAISESWAPDVLGMIETVEPLAEYTFEIIDNEVILFGLADTQADLDQVNAAFADGFPGGFSGTLDIVLGPRFLSESVLEPFLETHADCGRLLLMSPPALGYGFNDVIIVNGRFAEAASRAALENDIKAIAGQRAVRVEGEVLNDSLCEVDAVLPKAQPGGFDVRFGFGDSDALNPSGRYRVGQNPTIDVRLPDAVQDGYIWVSVIDVQGVVFHLLPNRTRPDNTIAALREEASEDGYVRMAYGLDEAEGRLAFTVDGSVLGKSKVVVVYADEPLFEDLRPTTESVASYAEALTEARDRGALRVTTLDSSILTTEE
jgi:serine/threonine-protein kinase